MKYLITGGCGFLGSNIASQLIRQGKKVVIVDNLYRFGSQENKKWLEVQGEFSFIHCDVRNANDVESIISIHRPDVLYHLAAQVAMTTSIDNPRLDFETNLLGSFNIINSVRKYCRDCIVVYSSTNKVYGDLSQYVFEELPKRYVCKDKPHGFDETVNLEFHSPYGVSKGGADQYMLDFSRIYGLNTIVFRHSSIYGGRQFATYDQGWVGWFIEKAVEIKSGATSEPFTISGDGKQVRDLLYVSDCVDLYLDSILKISEVRGQAFNIGGGIQNSYSLLELFDILESELSIKMEYISLPFRESDQKIFIADIAKAQKLLGWSPHISKEHGIKLMLDWLKENNGKS